MPKSKKNEIVNDKLKDLHKWQNSKCGIFRWGCVCCHPHTDEQRSMWRRTRRVLKQMLRKEPLE